MTLPELLALSKTPDGPEHIRVMVAEMAGWTRCDVVKDPWGGVWFMPGFTYPQTAEWIYHNGRLSPPDYTTSLDAVMPLVRALPVHQLTSYSINRAKIAAVDWTGHDDQSQYPNCGYYTSMKMLTSTALDICIALLATLKP
jgi:hypothetical protein